MAADQLLAALEAQARAEAAALVTQAETRAGAIEARAAAEVLRRRAAELARLEAIGRQAAYRELAAVERRHQEALLTARARVIAAIVERAGRRLGTLEIAAYRAAVPRLLSEALRYLEEAPAVVVCRPDVGGELGPLIAGSPGVAIEVRADADAGILARSADGRVVVDNTLGARLERARDELAVTLAAALEAR